MGTEKKDPRELLESEKLRIPFRLFILKLLDRKAYQESLEAIELVNKVRAKEKAKAHAKPNRIPPSQCLPKNTSMIPMPPVLPPKADTGQLISQNGDIYIFTTSGNWCKMEPYSPSQWRGDSSTGGMGPL